MRNGAKTGLAARAAVAAAFVLVAALPASAGGDRAADETLVVTGLDTQAKEARKNYDRVEFRLIVSGQLTVTYENGNTTVYDGMYCIKGWCSKPEPSSPIDMFVSDRASNPIPSTYGGLWSWNAAGDPKYDPVKHTYTLGPYNTGKTTFFRGMRFEVRRSIKVNCDCRISGSITIRIVTGTPAAAKKKLRVDFTVRVSGKPGVPIRGQGPQPATARLTATGHATFLLEEGAARLAAIETKGSASYSGGGKTLTMGIISGTSYFPATGRLVLLLKVNGSNDDNCEASGFLTGVRAATLTLLPVEGETDLGTAIFVGIPVTKKIAGIGPLTLEVTPCKGHTHGWRGGDGASVRMFIKETKLP